MFKRICRSPILCEWVVGIFCSLIIRLPLLGKWGNSDEAWYAAIAAYNVAYGKSPFECPGNNASPTIAVYQALTTLDGPYHKLPLDLLTLLICAGVAIWIFRIVRNECGWGTAALAAGGFLICQSIWEGGTSNREWFALPFLIGSVHLVRREMMCLRLGEPCVPARLILAGMCIAFACGMKEQSLPFAVLGPGTLLILKWRCHVNWKTIFQATALYSVGFAAGLILVLLPHVYWGTLSTYMQDFFHRVAVEGGQNMLPTGQRWFAILKTFGPGLILSTEGRSVILGFAVISAMFHLIPEVLRTKRHSSDSAIVLSIAYLASVVCVSGGGRFFDHYYLYLLPFALPMIAIAVVDIVARDVRANVFSAIFLIAVVTQSLWGTSRGVWADSKDVAIAIGCSLIACAVHWVTVRSMGRMQRILWWCESTRQFGVSAFFLSMIVLLGHRQFLNISSTDLAITEHTASLCESMERLRQTGDEIFVWGWQTRIYPASRMVPASQFVSAARVVHDFSKNQYFPELIPATPEMNELLGDLAANRPRFFVDASRRTYSLSDPRIYDLKRHAEMQQWVLENYRIEGQFGDFVLFVRQ